VKTNRQHGGGGLMIWACFVATTPGHLVVIESTVNSLYPRVKCEVICAKAKKSAKIRMIYPILRPGKDLIFLGEFPNM